MSDGHTGDSPFSGGGASGIITNTDVQEARCENYDIRYKKSGAPVREASHRNDLRGDAATHPSTSSASARYSIRQCAEKAREAASHLEDAARDGDFMEATTAGGMLTDALSRLWKLRSCRESEFAEIVNMLELALAKVDFESLSPEQCSALVKLLDECVLAGATDESEVRHARHLLRQGGFDPWRGLSLREDE